MTMLGIECPDNIYVVGKAVRVAQAIGDLKAAIALKNTEVQNLKSELNAFNQPDYKPAKDIFYERDQLQSQLAAAQRELAPFDPCSPGPRSPSCC